MSTDEPQLFAVPHLDNLAGRRGGRIRLYVGHGVVAGPTTALRRIVWPCGRNSTPGTTQHCYYALVDRWVIPVAIGMSGLTVMLVALSLFMR